MFRCQLISSAKLDSTFPDNSSTSWELLIERINYFLSEARDKRGMIISGATGRTLEKYHRVFAKALIASSLHRDSTF